MGLSLHPSLDAGKTQTLNTVMVAPPKELPPAPLPAKLEGNRSRLSGIGPYSPPQPALTLADLDPPVQQARSQPPRFGKKTRSQTAPVTTTPKRKVPKKQFTFPTRPGGGSGIDEPQIPPHVREKRTRKNSALSRGWTRTRRAVRVLRVFLRLRK